MTVPSVMIFASGFYIGGHAGSLSKLLQMCKWCTKNVSKAAYSTL